jgi:branched-chain amino acid transport system ATP-binding protein
MAYVSVERRPFAAIGASSLLTVDALWKSAGGAAVLADLSFQVGYGEVVGLTGPDPVARSMIVSLIGGQIKPNSGQIMLAGQEVTHLTPDARLWRGIARNCRASHLLPDLTVLENVILAGGIRHRPLYPRGGGRTLREDGLAMLELVGLEGLADCLVSHITALEARLVSMAAALMARPSILLLDEPTSGLCASGRAFGGLIGVLREEGVSVLLTARCNHPVMKLCDRLLVVREGRLLGEERQEEPDRVHHTPGSWCGMQ